MLDPAETLGAQLQRQHPDLAICTLGISGAPGSEYLAILDAVPARQPPDVWVVLLNAADIPESRGGRDGFHYFSDRPDHELTGHARTEPRWLNVAKQFALFRYINYSLDAKGIAHRLQCDLRLAGCAPPNNITAAPDSEIASFVNDSRRFVATLRRRAQARQAELVVVLNSFDPSRFGSKTLRDQDMAQRDVLRREFQRARIRYVDVEDTYARAPECRLAACYLFRDGHWSAVGHAAVARMIAPLLQP